ncbi:MAG TPA: GldG family protein [Syntrophales bacterium]|nr:GldG family protein [Syntrophales bacterium]HOX93894.1 GldG family protein [Syntrophales bacterium]HPI56200.1 GldG family protein [Syntrophales bacterium]HPN24388.1 GldG family protein [Syntrophales bacterium]HQM29018.1 GldG family protein [Syntrophales bacterium]
MRATLRATAAILLIGVITFCAITISSILSRSLRVDLTDNGLYTLSDGTRDIISGLSEPVTLKLFYSQAAALKGPESMRLYNNYYAYVRDLLKEYAKLSGGKIRLEFIDPRPDSEAAAEAVRYGLPSEPVTNEERFFFGMVLLTEFGQEKTIPFFTLDRQGLLEYDISRTIYNATQRNRKKIGVLSSIDLFGSTASPYMAKMLRMQGKKTPGAWNLIGQLKQDYRLVPLRSDVEEIDDVDALLIVHPENLHERTLYAIDHYVMKGGKLTVFVDPCFTSDAMSGGAAPGSASRNRQQSWGFSRLLGAWGLEMDPDAVVADPNLGSMVQFSEGERNRKLITLLSLSGSALNRNEPITAKLDNVKVLNAGHLKVREVRNVRARTLLLTTDSANLLKTGELDLHQPDPDILMQKFKGGREPLILATKLTGRFDTAFPGNAAGESTPSNPGTEKPGKPETAARGLIKSKDMTTIVVYADVDMVSNLFLDNENPSDTGLAAGNNNLLLNTMEELLGTGTLAGVRTRGEYIRPFKVIDNIEAKFDAANSHKIWLLKSNISNAQKQLALLERKSEDHQVPLLKNEALNRKKEIESRIAAQRRELWDLSEDKRQEVDTLISMLKVSYMLFAPVLVLITAGIVSAYRAMKKRNMVWRSL